MSLPMRLLVGLLGAATLFVTLLVVGFGTSSALIVAAGSTGFIATAVEFAWNGRRRWRSSRHRGARPGK